MEIRDSEVLIVVDVQRDFCRGGALAVPDGDGVVPAILALAPRFSHLVLTQDWHPPGHISFASSHAGCMPYQEVSVTYGSQTLWPDHCIQGTPGAEFHPDLHLPRAELILRKGFRPGIDSYSAFFENDRKTPTGLAGYLRERGLQRAFFAGLAYDYCVGDSAAGARECGFQAVVIAQACRSIDSGGSVRRMNERLRDLAVTTIADVY